jgi:hypothetical protein
MKGNAGEVSNLTTWPLSGILVGIFEAFVAPQVLAAAHGGKALQS